MSGQNKTFLKLEDSFGKGCLLTQTKFELVAVKNAFV